MALPGPVSIICGILIPAPPPPFCGVGDCALALQPRLDIQVGWLCRVDCSWYLKMALQLLCPMQHVEPASVISELEPETQYLISQESKIFSVDRAGTKCDKDC